MKIPIVRKLSTVNYADLKQVGGKAASLGEMLQAGIPVPPGYVITTEAFKAGMSEGLAKDVLSAFDQLGVPRVAVRSSAVAEDSKSASWAGQLESYLNTTREELIGAVERCWASIKSEHAAAYAAEHGVNEEQKAVAVVVQAMVNSDISGVLFTANPVTQNRSELLIEAAYGLGELLVQGEITPESIVVSRQGRTISHQPSRQHAQLIYIDGANKKVAIPKPGQIVNAELLHQLVNTAIQIEQHYRVPQDIEWAVEGGRLYIVQSRPITTLEPSDPKPVGEPRFELLSPDYRVMPFVISRLAYIMSVCVGRHIPDPPECILEFVGGNVNWYAEIPKWDVAAQGVVTRLLQDPGSFRDFNQILALDIGKLKDLSRHLYSESLEDLSNKELSSLHKTAMELYEQVYARGIIPTYTDLGTPYLSNELKSALAALTSEVDRVFVLMTTPSTLSEFAQEELSCIRLAADSSITRDSQAVIDHQRRYYWLTYGYEGPAYSVDDIWRRVEEYRGKKDDAVRRLEELEHYEQATSAEIDDTVAKLHLPHQLQMSLAIAREWVGQKAARKEAFFATYAAFDRIAEELAKRLNRPKSEIKLLSYSETQAAFENGVLPTDLADRAERSVFVYREKAEQVFIGATANAFLRNEIRRPEQARDASSINGQIAYVGRVSGVVRVIREPADMIKMRPGDILVSPATNPNLLPAMHQAAAFVTDVGGITCHAAIVAREMRKPCIIGTKTATQVLRDGDFVEVNADRGFVTVIARKQFDSNDYLLSFWAEGVSVFVTDVHMDVYRQLEALFIIDRGMFKQYFTKTSYEQALERGLKFYSDAHAFEEYHAGLSAYCEQFKDFYESAIHNQTSLSRSAVQLFCANTVKLCKDYTKMNFEFTDKAFSEQEHSPIIKTNLLKAAKFKDEVRAFMNTVLFEPNGYAARVFTILGKQFGVDSGVLENLTQAELLALFDGRKPNTAKVGKRQKAFVESYSLTRPLEGKDAQAVLGEFKLPAEVGQRIEGQAANPGSATGKVKIIPVDYSNPDRVKAAIEAMQAGDILVAETTAPELLLACKKAAAIVTDMGGLLSHAAIVSRELGIPCIVGTLTASKSLKDGDVVSVDANHGEIQIVSRAHSE